MFFLSPLSLSHTHSFSLSLSLSHSHYLFLSFPLSLSLSLFLSICCLDCLLIASSTPLGGWGEYRFLENQSFCFCNWKLSQSYTFFMIESVFCVPCLVMSFCYVRIIKSVRKSNRRLMSLDQRLSASFADMESDNPQSDGPSASSQIPDIPENSNH
ncbi:unnamed protein product [Acanthosepion pharaonis]|uniref:G-protein coupled receptors family 1 profile domain-containing protein n=1 Tax=Acanthosepion pharaonis TaxID=158019 RepID=A0A812CCK6_ACAPH|nr:unnamed protein product [Sepia pharaonis]